MYSTSADGIIAVCHLVISWLPNLPRYRRTLAIYAEYKLTLCVIGISRGVQPTAEFSCWLHRTQKTPVSPSNGSLYLFPKVLIVFFNPHWYASIGDSG